MLIASLLIVIAGISVFNLTVSHEISKKCVESFVEFENETIWRNPENINQLFQNFYATNKPFPLSLQIQFYHQFQNGSRLPVKTDKKCLKNETWLWLSSSLYLLIEPTKLNMYALNTLSFFEPWNPPKVELPIPLPCENVSLDFLSETVKKVSLI